MSASALTPQTAPRDPSQLAQITPYQIRSLGEKVGAFASDAARMAWHGMNNVDRANEVARLLQLWDQQNPGQYQGGAAPIPQQAPPQQQAPQQAPPQQQFAPPPQAAQQQYVQEPPQQQQYAPPPQQFAQQAPPQQQQYAPPPQQQAPQQSVAQPMTLMTLPGMAIPGMTNGVPTGVAMGIPGMGGQQMAGGTFTGFPNGAPGAPPQVPSGVVAAAQQAAASAPAATGGKRQPKTSAAGAPADVGADVIGLLTRLAEGQGAQQKTLEAFGQMLNAATSAKESRLTTVEGNMKVLGDMVAGVQQTMNNTQQVVIWLLIMNLNLISEKQDASVIDVLRMAMGDAAQFNQLVAQASGKA